MMWDLKKVDANFNHKLKYVALTRTSHAWIGVVQNKTSDKYLSQCQTPTERINTLNKIEISKTLI